MGEELGNFQIDFSMDSASTEIYAIEIVFLGEKKTYIDILESTDKDGKTINSEHIRMKGTPTPCTKYYAQQKGITVSDVYKELFKNKTIKFGLANGNTKLVCKSNRDRTIPNVPDFTRKCQYIRDGSDKFFINQT